MPADHPVAFDAIPHVRMAAIEARKAASSGTVGALAIDPGPTATIRVGGSTALPPSRATSSTIVTTLRRPSSATRASISLPRCR